MPLVDERHPLVYFLSKSLDKRYLIKCIGFPFKYPNIEVAYLLFFETVAHFEEVELLKLQYLSLNLRHNKTKPEDLDLPQSTIDIDDDGIIPIIQEAEFFTDYMTARVEDAVEILIGRVHKAENMKYP